MHRTRELPERDRFALLAIAMNNHPLPAVDVEMSEVRFPTPRLVLAHFIYL